MTLSTGARLGVYEVVAPIGAGGMGEVYRARDTKLNREVALKVLPPAFSSDPQYMARLEREAQMLAALNHPNIAAIYGLEGEALVMELVEGETLAQRIAQGPVPLDEALPIARQIAEGLETAHEKGIIHRDLKPENIKITPAGTVKILDFGLAKAVEEPSAISGNRALSPTLSLAMTQAGMILGTAAYMAPEQARGKPVDRRADIWAFGVVLYEMLVGRQLFGGGDTVTYTLAAVVTREPDGSALPTNTPQHIRRLLDRCMRKDLRMRLQHIGEARILLEEGEDAFAAATAASSTKSQPAWLAWTVAGVLAVAFAVTGALLYRSTQPVSRPLLRFNADLGADVTLPTLYGSSVILSPDGSRLVFVGVSSDSRTHLYTRLLDQPRALLLAGTDGVRNPFFSPDGQWIGFFADTKLKKISVQGGAAVTLCDAPDDRGGGWGEDAQIVFAPQARVGLAQVSAAGGVPKPLTELDKGKTEVTHRWPQVVAGGQAVLFTAAVALDFDNANIEVWSLRNNQRKILQRGGMSGRYVAGHLVYVHKGTLFAAPMNLDRLELTGPAAPAVEEVVNASNSGGAQFAFSQNGDLVFVAGKSSGTNATVAWLDSSGKTQPLRAVPGNYLQPRFSSDGKRLALAVLEGGNWDVWVYEWERDTMLRLTFRPEQDSHPVWAPDGKHIAFCSAKDGGVLNLYWMRSDGAGEAVRLTETKNQQNPYSSSPDGKRLAYHELTPESGQDLYTLPLDLSDPDHPKAGKAEPFLRTPATEVYPVFSPDGRWLAYASNESTNMEVYVRPFPGPGGRWQISTGGGVIPVWSSNGKELFYRTPDSRIMVATYSAKGDAFQADKPRIWSEKRFLDRGIFTNFDLAPDGKRFAVMMAPEGVDDKPPNHVTFLLNFSDELHRRVSTGAK